MNRPADPRLRIPAPTTAGAALLLVLAACAPGTGTHDVVDDQTGEGASWLVDPTPRVSVGVVSGDEAYELGEISAGAVRSDGGILLADNRTKTLRRYDADGVFVSEWGGEGLGPGEFLSPTQLVLGADDAVTVWDAGIWRATRYDADGRLLGVSTFRRDDLIGLVEPDLAPLTAFILAGGGYLIPMLEKEGMASGGKGGGTRAKPGRAEAGEVLTRQRVAVVRVTADVAGPEPVAELGWDEQVEVAAPWGPLRLAPPLGRRPVFAVQPNASNFCVGDQSEASVACFNAAGSQRTVAWNATPTPVTRDDPEIDVWRKEMADLLGQKLGPGVIEAVLGQVPLPTIRPPYGQLILDRRGNLWVEQGPADHGASTAYLVFDEDGGEVALALLPQGRVLEIDDHRVLLVQSDELGVQFVHLYSLEKAR